MPSISNTGKSITVSFTPEEQTRMVERDAEAWKWQCVDFNIGEDGIGQFSFHADMFKGRKLGLMKTGGAERWMLVIPSQQLPLVPYFKKISASATFNHDDVVVNIPRELPALSERKQAQIAGLRKTVQRPKVKAEPAKVEPTETKVKAKPQGQHNLMIMIEGQSFRFDVPVQDRLRFMNDLAAFAVIDD